MGRQVMTLRQRRRRQAERHGKGLVAHRQDDLEGLLGQEVGVEPGRGGVVVQHGDEQRDGEALVEPEGAGIGRLEQRLEAHLGVGPGLGATVAERIDGIAGREARQRGDDVGHHAPQPSAG